MITLHFPGKQRLQLPMGKILFFISAVVIWEIRIKQALGKLAIPPNFQKVLNAQPFEMLDITVEHAYAI
jgi:PIN domain nuclease of toxin-antitoxin system